MKETIGKCELRLHPRLDYRGGKIWIVTDLSIKKDYLYGTKKEAREKIKSINGGK